MLLCYVISATLIYYMEIQANPTPNSNIDDPIHKYPWLVTLNIMRKGFFCTGTLISKNYVLTAAHCVDQIVNTTGIPRHVSKVKTGIIPLSLIAIVIVSINSDDRIYYPKKIKIHPEFFIKDEFQLIADIALIQLSHPVQFCNDTKFVCLATDTDEDYVPEEAIILGHGDEKPGISADDMREVHVPIKSHEECKEELEIYDAGLSKTSICAGGKGTKDCVGDSGSPLLISSNGMHTIIGVNSLGTPQCGTDIPIICTRINIYSSWIRENSDYTDENCGASENVDI